MSLLNFDNSSYLEAGLETLLGQLETSLQNSLLLSLALAYVGGLLASLTPCIYPMIPITAGIIGHANVGGSSIRGFSLSLLYILGMALTYSALGVFAAATGSFFGSIASTPWTYLIVGNVVVLFALGMLDVFPLPTLTGGVGQQRQGFGGIFLAGISAALVAGPCTTPVLGSLLAYTASSHSVVTGGLLLFSFSLGLGTLLVAVGTFSGVLTAIPRSGAWMVVVKRVLGGGMLLLAEYLFFKAGTLFF